MMFNQVSWGIFCIRLVISMVMVGMTGVGTAWFIADWATERALTAQTAHIQGVEARQTADRQDLSLAITEFSKRLEASMNELSTKMDSLGQRVDNLGQRVDRSSDSMVGLTGSVTQLDTRMDESVKRQTAFEAFVVASLVQAAPSGPIIPMDTTGRYWVVDQGVSPDVYKTLLARSGGAVNKWFDLYTGEK